MIYNMIIFGEIDFEVTIGLNLKWLPSLNQNGRRMTMCHNVPPTFLQSSDDILTTFELKLKGHESTHRKYSSSQSIIEANEIISDSTECAEIMNNFFNDAAYI